MAGSQNISSRINQLEKKLSQKKKGHIFLAKNRDGPVYAEGEKILIKRFKEDYPKASLLVWYSQAEWEKYGPNEDCQYKIFCIISPQNATNNGK